jgi:NAD(P)-dependent dehydrogenase (short-subunit alcohol dehydrogenase family)
MNLLLITGASAGIGLATARRFADGGYDVVNLSRDGVRSRRSHTSIAISPHRAFWTTFPDNSASC